MEGNDIHVIVDIPEYENSDFLNMVEKYQIVGLDTANPLLTFDKKFFFKGEWIDYPATGLVFSHENRGNGVGNTVDDIERTLSFKCKTTKFLRFREIYIREKEEESGGVIQQISRNEQVSQNDDVVLLTRPGQKMVDEDEEVEGEDEEKGKGDDKKVIEEGKRTDKMSDE